jgi:small ligand-binding sensory domain FIST
MWICSLLIPCLTTKLIPELALGNQIKSKNYKGDPNILIMYDAIKEPNPTAMSLNLATPLIKGIEKSIGNWPNAAGVGMMGDFQWNRTYQWFDDQIFQDTAMALVLSGGVRMDTIIMHGCKPSSDYHKITKADGNVVLEIDGKPAVDMIANLTWGKLRAWVAGFSSLRNTRC